MFGLDIGTKKQTLAELIAGKNKAMVELLRNNQIDIDRILREKGVETFKLFGDHIPNTASGIAKVNVLVLGVELGYLDMAALQKSLQKLLSSTVNIYTEATLRDPASVLLVENIFSNAKTLEEILGLEPAAEASASSSRAVASFA